MRRFQHWITFFCRFSADFGHPCGVRQIWCIECHFGSKIEDAPFARHWCPWCVDFGDFRVYFSLFVPGFSFSKLSWCLSPAFLEGGPQCVQNSAPFKKTARRSAQFRAVPGTSGECPEMWLKIFFNFMFSFAESYAWPLYLYKAQRGPQQKKIRYRFSKSLENYAWSSRRAHTEAQEGTIFQKIPRSFSRLLLQSLCKPLPVGCSCCCLFGPGGYAKTLKKQGEEPFLNPINNIVSNSTVWSTLINRCQTPCSPPLFFNQGRRHFCQISFKFARLAFLGVNSKTQDKRGTPTKNKKKFRTNNNNVGGKKRKRILPA